MTQKQLPCTVCGEPVTVPAKYAKAKSATCGKCQPAADKGGLMGSRTLTNILLAAIAVGLIGPQVPHVAQGVSDWLATQQQERQLKRDREAGKAAAIAECRERGYRNTSSETSGLKYCLRHLLEAHEYFDWDVPIRDQL